MREIIQATDLRFFSTLAASGSLSGAARELGLTPAAVSKHLTQMEARAGVSLVNRTTRSMMLTAEGELYLEHAQRILHEIGGLAELLESAKRRPRGLLRINAMPGLGRVRVAPVVSRFITKYPQVSVQLQLSAAPSLMTDDAFDLCIRCGAPSDGRVIARCLAPNRRLLCAAPSYLARCGMPQGVADLARHNCIGIRQGDEAYGVWRFLTGRGAARRTETLKISGNLTTNDSDTAVSWALDGHGILLRSEWDIRRHLESGDLVQVLPEIDTPNADIFAIYPQRHQQSNRVRMFVDFAALAFKEAA